MPTMIDLCCGLGGASAAMRDRGWQVTSYDLMADVKPDVLCDVRNLLTLPRNVDLLWASTNCQQFSIRNLPFPSCVKARRPIDLSVEYSVASLIAQSHPRFWIVENVHMSRRWLTPVFGPVRCIIPGHVLYGRLPGLLPSVPHHKGDFGRNGNTSRALTLKRSVVPYEISLAIALAVERRLADETVGQP